MFLGTWLRIVARVPLPPAHLIRQHPRQRILPSPIHPLPRKPQKDPDRRSATVVRTKGLEASAPHRRAHRVGGQDGSSQVVRRQVEQGAGGRLVLGDGLTTEVDDLPRGALVGGAVEGAGAAVGGV